MCLAAEKTWESVRGKDKIAFDTLRCTRLSYKVTTMIGIRGSVRQKESSFASVVIRKEQVRVRNDNPPTNCSRVKTGKAKLQGRARGQISQHEKLKVKKSPMLSTTLRPCKQAY